jgi:hypothetical protein
MSMYLKTPYGTTLTPVRGVQILMGGVMQNVSKQLKIQGHQPKIQMLQVC